MAHCSERGSGCLGGRPDAGRLKPPKEPRCALRGRQDERGVQMKLLCRAPADMKGEERHTLGLWLENVHRSERLESACTSCFLESSHMENGSSDKPDKPKGCRSEDLPKCLCLTFTLLTMNGSKSLILLCLVW